MSKTILFLSCGLFALIATHQNLYGLGGDDELISCDEFIQQSNFQTKSNPKKLESNLKKLEERHPHYVNKENDFSEGALKTKMGKKPTPTSPKKPALSYSI